MNEYNQMSLQHNQWQKFLKQIIHLSFFASYPQRNGYNLLCIEFFWKGELWQDIPCVEKTRGKNITRFFKKTKVRKQLAIEWKQKWRDINQSRLVFYCIR